MKKIVILLIACLLASMLVLPASAANQGKTYMAEYGTPRIDGEIDDVWNLVPWAKTDTGNKDGIVARFKVLHDDDTMYFLIQFTDKKPMSSECIQIWLHEDDCGDTATCDDFTEHLFQINGMMWTQRDNLAPGNGKSVMVKDHVVYRKGSLYTYEIAMTLHNGLSENGVRLEVVMEDYDTDINPEYNGWLEPRAWNSDAGNGAWPQDYGTLYFLPDVEGREIPTAELYPDETEFDDTEEVTTTQKPAKDTTKADTTKKESEAEPEVEETEPKAEKDKETEANTEGKTDAKMDLNSILWIVFAVLVVALIVAACIFLPTKKDEKKEAKEDTKAKEKPVAQPKAEQKAQTADKKSAKSYLPMILIVVALIVAAVVVLVCVRGASNGGEGTEADTTAAQTEEQTKSTQDTQSTTTSPSNEGSVSASADGLGTSWINAKEFGFVADGKTPNDEVMQKYIDNYYKTPIYFSEGVYCFEKSIDFPDTMHIQLDPYAELKCIAKEPLECFITLRKDVTNWCHFTQYAQQSYIKGGIINANYCAKIAIGVSQGYHTQFSGFRVMNVLEKGIQTNYNEKGFSDGCSNWSDIIIYNDRCLPGSYGVYDNHPDSNFTKVDVTNFETAYYTHGGRFYQCAAWNLDMQTVENSTYAYIAGGHQSLFVNCSVDTQRYGFVLGKNENGDRASCAISNATWITNTNVYPDHLQKEYPRTVFYCDEPNEAQFYVIGMQLPGENYLSMSNAEMKNSVFLNIRTTGKGASIIPNFRNDTDILKTLAFTTTETPAKTALNAGDDFDKVTIPYTYDCELRVGTGGKNVPPVKETGVLEVTKVGTKVVQKFIGTQSYAQRIFDGTKWGGWIVMN